MEVKNEKETKKMCHFREDEECTNCSKYCKFRKGEETEGERKNADK